MGLCSASSKCALLIINLLFWLCAALLIYAGVKYIEASDGVLDDVHKKPALIAFGAGALLFICGLIGIAGAFAEKKILLGIFSIFIVATLVLFVFTSVTLFTKKDDARNETDVFLLKQFNHYNSPNLTALDLSLKRLPRDTSMQVDDTTTTTTVEPPSSTTTTTEPTTTTKTTATTTTTDKSTTTSATTTKPTTTTKTTATTTTTTEKTTTSTQTTTPHKTNGTTKGTTTTKSPKTTTAPATTAPSSSGVNSTEFIDTIQSKLECCGYVNYSDWNTYETWGHKGFVPNSCCNETAADGKNKTCGKGMISVKHNADLIFTKGCQKEVDDVVVEMFKLLSWVSIGICLFVLLCFAAAMYLMCRKKDDGFSYSSIVA